MAYQNQTKTGIELLQAKKTLNIGAAALPSYARTALTRRTAARASSSWNASADARAAPCAAT